MQQSGIHVAFCAGTGALVFLDLVAQLLVLNTFKHDGKPLPEEIESFYQPEFKFILYVAFQDRKQSIGLDLIEALEKVNEKLGLNNFKVIVRLSDPDKGEEKKPRWTPNYIEKELSQYEGKLRKVWVCGPPAVNEMFDKTFNQELLTRLQLEKHQVDIM